MASQNQEDELEKPRSHSLPNMEYNGDIEGYEFLVQRDFRNELQTYFKQKQVLQKQMLKEKMTQSVVGN